METPPLFPAPDEDQPDDPDERDEQDIEPSGDADGGEYILHFRDVLGRFTYPPSR